LLFFPESFGKNRLLERFGISSGGWLDMVSVGSSEKNCTQQKLIKQLSFNFGILGLSLFFIGLAFFIEFSWEGKENTFYGVIFLAGLIILALSSFFYTVNDDDSYQETEL
jgi:hypothetical protein